MRPVIAAAATGQLVLTALFCSVGVMSGADYNVTVLSPTSDMPQTTPVVAAALNNPGQVAGFEVDPKGRKIPLVWTDAVPVKLDVPPGYQLTGINSINARGQVLGAVTQATSGTSEGILWTDWVPQIIGGPILGCDAQAATLVFNMNAAGHVIGHTTDSSCDVFWVLRRGVFTAITPPADARGFNLIGINDADHIFGYAPLVAFGPYEIYEIGPGGLVYRFPFPDPFSPFWSLPNNLDQFAALAVQEGPSFTYLFTGPSTPVGLPPTTASSIYFSNVNNAGVVYAGGVLQKGTTVLGSIVARTGVNGNPILNDGLRFLASSVFGGTPPNALFTPTFGTTVTDVTNQVLVLPDEVQFNSGTHRFTQKVTLMNLGREPIAGPIFLVLDHLPPDVALYGLTGTTIQIKPSGTPYVRVPISFGAPGEPTILELQFLDEDGDGDDIRWIPRVIAGSGGC
jgi:hypothetical protein